MGALPLGLGGLLGLMSWGCAWGQPAGSARPEADARPKLVVGITVDQMRPDYLSRYWADFEDGGFKRLYSGGFVCADHHFGYAPTFTGPGHASIYTGTTPAFHGILANDWYDRRSRSSVYCAEDTAVRGVGTRYPDDKDGRMSPHRMLASTLGDELKLASNNRSRVIGISMKDRGAILPAGHAADAAYWFRGKDEGVFITSSYYMDALPDWAANWNRKSPADKLLKAGWELLLPASRYDESYPDNNPYEGPFKGSPSPTFPYDLKALAQANGGYDILKATPAGNVLMVDFALAALEGEQLGRDAFTDLLAISFSSPDYVGHQFGLHAMETQDAYLRLDRELARLFEALDREVGEGQWLAWLSADHAGAPVPSLVEAQGWPVGYWKPGNMVDAVRADLVAQCGEDVLLRYSNDQFFLDRQRIRELGKDLAYLQDRVMQLALEQPEVLLAVTAGQLTGPGAFSDDIRERLRMGHHAYGSGDVVVVTRPGWMQYGRTGTTHGSPFPYDTHAPLIFYGWGVPQGITYERTHIRDIAPTVAALIHSPLPNACTGRVITPLFE
ncbi:MAG: hypothetical protein RJA19_91 [Bacteroidota bacterium]